jgi:hypothetical protein
MLPQINSVYDPSVGQVTTEIEIGASLLVTHGCDLDKPAGSQPRIERLQFVPLRDLSYQTKDRQDLLRRRHLAPAEAIYVGQVAGVGEAFGLWSEMYSLPAAFFRLALVEFPEDERAEAGKLHLVAGRHGNREGRLSDEDIDLLHKKMAAFWPRLQVTPPADAVGAEAVDD